jgi:hypothetical protein
MGLVFGSATQASAHQWTDPASWGGGHTISTSAGISGNVVKVWQMALATRFSGWCFGPCTGYPSISGGGFGPVTSNYTQLWQAQHSFAGLAVDGIVGPQTWNAMRFFHVGASTGSYGGWVYYTYTDTYTGNPANRTFGFDYAQPYATWFAHYCTDSTYQINHPVNDQYLYGYNCD